MGTVSKALSLLNYFTRARPEIGLSDLARLTGMNKATVYRHMSEMAELGFVEQTLTGKSYRLGPEVLRLAALREAAVPLLEVARHHLKRLSDATDETAHLSIMRGQQLAALSHQYSTRHGTRVTMEDAEVLSFHGTASGLSILAFADPEFQKLVLDQPLFAHTNATETDPDRIRARLSAIRDTGFAQSIGGFEEDVHSIATPVFGADSLPIGALALAVPVGRMTDQMIALAQQELAICASDLTRRIGGFPPSDFPLPAQEMTT